MKLKLKCDDCGVIGSPSEIHTSQTYERDLCMSCLREAKLHSLKAKRDELKQWLENTHLKKLRELETSIQDFLNDGS